jgi:hypothetical protein
MISFASPILDSNQQPQGVLYGFYNPQKFAEISSIDTENKNVITVLMDQKGNLLTSSDKSNIFFGSGNLWENEAFKDHISVKNAAGYKLRKQRFSKFINPRGTATSLL